MNRMPYYCPLTNMWINPYYPYYSPMYRFCEMCPYKNKHSEVSMNYDENMTRDALENEEHINFPEEEPKESNNVECDMQADIPEVIDLSSIGNDTRGAQNNIENELGHIKMKTIGLNEIMD
ncbi:hypothetical protein FDF74_01660 [Clostridium niameyense]|uniref:Uncharacterized protein n=1 Tax=Clostridium niameyense TaxID=1622073 RepID=A0A6M0R6V9_9CLOT|nr:hypothetical protein [Clostridium niameyense]NEZ45914.1 hypothetical protein [Clostridium niameyense]